MVEGGIFPVLVEDYAAELAGPLASIFNTMTRTLVWPIERKKETVTVIPKMNFPESFADLRRFFLLSKIYESYKLGTGRDRAGK